MFEGLDQDEEEGGASFWTELSRMGSVVNAPLMAGVLVVVSSMTLCNANY